MQHHSPFRISPQTFSLLAMILFMSMFGAGIAYEGVSLMEPARTEQLAVPDMNF
jgi:hypothetical protein